MAVECKCANACAQRTGDVLVDRQTDTERMCLPLQGVDKLSSELLYRMRAGRAIW